MSRNRSQLLQLPTCVHTYVLRSLHGRGCPHHEPSSPQQVNMAAANIAGLQVDTLCQAAAHLSKIEVAEDVCVKGFLQLLWCDVSDALSHLLLRSIVDKHIQSTQLLNNLGHNILSCLQVQQCAVTSEAPVRKVNTAVTSHKCNKNGILLLVVALEPANACCACCCAAYCAPYSLLCRPVLASV